MVEGGHMSLSFSLRTDPYWWQWEASNLPSTAIPGTHYQRGRLEAECFRCGSVQCWVGVSDGWCQHGHHPESLHARWQGDLLPGAGIAPWRCPRKREAVKERQQDCL